MPQKTNSFEKFWKELKRRKVVHVITVYTAVAFVILQLVDIVAEPLRLPIATRALVIVLLCIGFVIAVFLSWVYDLTPAGIRKTKTVSTIKPINHTPPLTSRGWKVATYTSAVIILFLIGFNFINRRSFNRDISKLEKSIAVLPFRNDSRDSTNQYFINGIMEKITTNLQMIKTLRVLSRTSVEQYRNTTKSIPEIAKELDVNYIVEGSGQKFGNLISVTTQLLNAKGKETHLWAKTYDQEVKEVNDYIRIEGQIAQSIAAELKIVITPDEKYLLEKLPTENIKAYNEYLKGLDYQNKGATDNRLQAIEYYKNALTIDPKFAAAYVGISTAYSELIWDNLLPEDVYPQAKNAALKALEIDNKLSEAHAALAYILIHYDWDIIQAERELNKAITLNPNSSYAYEVYSTLLDISCRFDEAVEKYKKVLSLNPNSDDMRFYYGYLLYRAYGSDSAILIMKNGVDIDSNKDWKHYLLGYVYLQNEDYLKSIKELEKALELNPVPQAYYLYLGIAYNKSGKPDKTKEILQKLNILGQKNTRVAVGKAALYSELGETDQAIFWLRAALEERHQFILYLKSVPIMCSSIRSDPRFLEIYNKIWPNN
jgi:TolB-like protein/Tfp pilus assembly protein PilF